MYGYQPSTPVDQHLPLAEATLDVADRLALIVVIRDCVNHLLELPEEIMAARSTRTVPLFQPGDIVYLSTRGLRIRSQKKNMETNDWVP
jgi:hypothetical protein